MRRLLASRRAVVLLLAVLTLAGGALRAHQAANPTADYQSADERSYGRLALEIAEEGRYGPNYDELRPLHWPPAIPAMLALAHAIPPDAASARTADIPADR